MPSAAYLALLSQPSVRWKVLCELTARQELHGWASEGSDTYSIAFDSYSHPVALRADRGLYREVVGVIENSEALPLEVSVAAVKAGFIGAYFFDAATATLYVKTSGNVSPDTVALVQVLFTVRVATEPVSFAGTPPYDAQIDGQSLPTMRFERPELLRGVSAFPSGDLTLANADGFWDYPAAAWNWTNTTAAFFAGGDDMVRADYEPLPAMQIVKAPAAGDAAATFQLRSFSNATDRAFPQHTVADFYTPDAALVIGVDANQYMPMMWGIVRDVPLIQVGDISGQNKWIPCDPLVGVFALDFSGALVAIEKSSGVRTTLVDGMDFLFLGGSDGAFQITLTYPSADYDIVVEEVEPGGAATCGAIALAILLECGVPLADIDTAAFTQADLDNPARLGIYVPGGHDVSALTTGTELLNLLERSSLSSIYLGTDGRWTMQVWDPSFTLASLPVRSDADLLTWAPVPAMTTPIISAVTVRYARRVYADTWATKSRTSEASDARLQTTNTQIVDTCLVDESDAIVLAARAQMVAQSSPLEVRVEDGPASMGLVPGDKLRITRARGASLAGTFDQPMEVQSILKRPASMTVEMTLGNQRGLGALVKVAAPDTVPTWPTATAEEKLQYGFATDDNDVVVAGDGSTYRHSVAW